MIDTMCGGIKSCDLANNYFKAIENKFKESQKAEIAQYMTLLTTYKFEGGDSIRDHIMKMTDAIENFNSLDMNICEKQLVFMILQALPLKYSQLKVYYNTQDKSWMWMSLYLNVFKRKIDRRWIKEKKLRQSTLCKH